MIAGRQHAMKVLWVNTNFMHPTNKGGSIRSIEMLRYLHQWHEIHFVAIADGDFDGRLAVASERLEITGDRALAERLLDLV